MAQSKIGDGTNTHSAISYQDPLKIGASIARKECKSCFNYGGSIGAFVEDKNGTYILTAKHVLDESPYRDEYKYDFKKDCCPLSRWVVQPSEAYIKDNKDVKGLKEMDRVVGEIYALINGTFKVDYIDYYIDAALVKLDGKRKASGGLVELKKDRLTHFALPLDLSFDDVSPAEINPKQKVLTAYKVGAKTGLRRGEIIVDNGKIYHDVEVTLNDETFYLQNFIMIKDSQGNVYQDMPFAKQGDSGAAVFTYDRTTKSVELLGILVLCFEEEGTYVVTPIGPILKKFGVSLCNEAVQKLAKDSGATHATSHTEELIEPISTLTTHMDYEVAEHVPMPRWDPNQNNSCSISLSKEEMRKLTKIDSSKVDFVDESGEIQDQILGIDPVSDGVLTQDGNEIIDIDEDMSDQTGAGLEAETAENSHSDEVEKKEKSTDCSVVDWVDEDWGDEIGEVHDQILGIGSVSDGEHVQVNNVINLLSKDMGDLMGSGMEAETAKNSHTDGVEKIGDSTVDANNTQPDAGDVRGMDEEENQDTQEGIIGDKKSEGKSSGEKEVTQDEDLEADLSERVENLLPFEAVQVKAVEKGGRMRW